MQIIDQQKPAHIRQNSKLQSLVDLSMLVNVFASKRIRTFHVPLRAFYEPNKQFP